LLNKVFKVFFVFDQYLSLFSMNLNDNLVLSYLSLQLNLDRFLCLLLLHTFLYEIKQLIFVSLNLSLLFLNLIDLICELLLHLLSLKSLIGELSLKALLHIFLFVCLKLLELVEGINEVLVVRAQLFGLPLSGQHLDEAINV
jgi:hypothetical protein